MKKASTPVRISLVGLAVFVGLSATAGAQEVQQLAEVLTAPNASAPPARPEVNNGATPPNQIGEEGAPPAIWNDTFIGYRWGTDFHYPGIDSSIVQNIGYLTTIGGFRFGSYAFNVDYLVSNAANPEAGGPNTGGAQEVYSVGRVQFSAGKILGRSMQFGPVRDWGLTVGYEFGTKNDAYGERARMLVVGPTVEFKIPHGFANLTVGLRTESNHNGITGQDVRFNTAWHIESSWLYPLRVGPVPLVFRGFAGLTGPKGRDGFGVETTTEFLTRMALLADLGSFAGHPRVFYAGLGYEYWYHMYGTPTHEAPGTITSVPMFQAEIHF
jgi:nucleoside-specific outer membrane channel protein Tsx